MKDGMWGSCGEGWEARAYLVFLYLLSGLGNVIHWVKSDNPLWHSMTSCSSSKWHMFLGLFSVSNKWIYTAMLFKLFACYIAQPPHRIIRFHISQTIKWNQCFRKCAIFLHSFLSGPPKGVLNTADGGGCCETIMNIHTWERCQRENSWGFLISTPQRRTLMNHSS